MSYDFLSLALSGVQKLSPYIPGKPIDELARELNLNPNDIVKLASNENPLGPSPKALEAIHNSLNDITRYPDGNGFILKEALAKRYQVNHDQITLGNGSNELLEIIACAFLKPGLNAIYSQYAFTVYSLVTTAIGAEGKEVPANAWGHDLKGILKAIDEQTRLIFVANPNNPTGTWFSHEHFEQFMQQVPSNVLVVLDEAYIEYAQGDTELTAGLALLANYPNLLISRTFSKAYGLAALRVGYVLSHPQLAEILNRVREPFNVNSFALAAAAAALTDHAYLEKSCQVNQQGMKQLKEGLKQLGLSTIESKGNFIAVDMGQEAMPIFQALLKEGVIVRPLAGYNMAQFLRISIGLETENNRCLQALTKVLRG